MSSLTVFENLNIRFDGIDKIKAADILENEYSLHRLLQFTSIFDKYTSTDKKGQFVNLRFDQLYYLSIIDERFSQILMRECQEIEIKLKTLFLNDVNCFGIAKEFLFDYIKNDFDYINRYYPNLSEDFLSNDIDENSLDEFVDKALFGTFSRMLNVFINRYKCGNISSVKAKKYLLSIQRVRNRVAHSVPLLSDLMIKKNNDSMHIIPYLKKEGLCHKTVHTNLSRVVIYDICNLWQFYSFTQSKQRLNNNYRDIKKFLSSIYRKYKKAFKNNQCLSSSFYFLQRVAKIYSRKLDI